MVNLIDSRCMIIIINTTPCATIWPQPPYSVRLIRKPEMLIDCILLTCLYPFCILIWAQGGGFPQPLKR